MSGIFFGSTGGIFVNRVRVCWPGTATTIRLAKMNLAVHGLEGDIVEANTFYEDEHDLLGKCDYVMAKAIVRATTHHGEPEVVAEVSRGLGDAMRGLETAGMPEAELMQTRGW